MTIGAAQTDQLEPVLWMDAEPRRLERDKAEVLKRFPDVVYGEPDLDVGFHGGWAGFLPRWPFERPEPDGLVELIGEQGIEVLLLYSAAHPMIAPRVESLDPKPDFEEQTQTRWHVAPGGSLCLLRSDAAWRPEESIVDLLLKAAAWRVEYALMKAGVIEEMTVRGIVNDDSRDHLVAKAAQNNSPRRLPGQDSYISEGGGTADV